MLCIIVGIVTIMLPKLYCMKLQLKIYMIIALKILQHMINTFIYLFYLKIKLFNIYEFLKIDENTFIYSMSLSSHNIFLAKIIDNRIYKTEIHNCGQKLIYFSEKKKLITHDERFIYLINFNSTSTEVIQKVEIRYLYKNKNMPYHSIRDANLLRYLTSFNDESIYLVCDQFFVQYIIIGGELMEISRMNYI